MSKNHELTIEEIIALISIIDTANSEEELDIIIRDYPVECMFNKKINLYLKSKRMKIRKF